MVNQKNHEEELKKVIFDRIYDIQERNQDILASTKTLGRNMGIDMEPSNLSKTAISKLVTDIVPQFKRAGLKFYSDSVVSQAIYLQIIDYMEQGNRILQKYSNSLTTKKKDEGKKETKELVQSNRLSRMWADFKKLFSNLRRAKSTISPECIEEAKGYIDEFEDLNQDLKKYNLRDKIIPALTKVICPKDNFVYLAITVPALVDEDIAPVFQKLGLGDLILQLEKTLVEEYTRNEEGRIEQCVSQDEMDLYIPNFEKYREKKERKAGIAEEKVGRSKGKPSIGQNQIFANIIETETDGVEPGED